MASTVPRAVWILDQNDGYLLRMNVVGRGTYTVTNVAGHSPATYKGDSGSEPQAIGVRYYDGKAWVGLSDLGRSTANLDESDDPGVFRQGIDLGSGTSTILLFNSDGTLYNRYWIGGGWAKTLCVAPNDDLIVAWQDRDMLGRYRLSGAGRTPAIGESGNFVGGGNPDTLPTGYAGGRGGFLRTIWEVRTGRRPRGVLCMSHSDPSPDNYRIWTICKQGTNRQSAVFPDPTLDGDLNEDGFHSTIVQHRLDGSVYRATTVPFGARGIWFDSSGYAWVTTFGNGSSQGGSRRTGRRGMGHWLVKISPSGLIVGMVRTTRSYSGSSKGNGLYGVMVDKLGNVIVPCASESIVQKFTSSGVEIGNPWWDAGAYGMQNPIAVATDVFGDIWVANAPQIGNTGFFVVLDGQSAATSATVLWDARNSIAGFTTQFPKFNCQVIGDASGIHAGVRLHASEDADADNSTNASEWNAVPGSSPFG